MKPPFILRKIEKKDNHQVKVLILKVMAEYHTIGKGFSSEDAEIENMYEAYNREGSSFYVIEKAGKILGCGGIGSIPDADRQICELRKMYFYSELRRQGMGTKLLDKCLETAREMGYKKCYLETCSQMINAQKLYEKNGFKLLPDGMFDTGHFGCNAFYLKTL